MILFEENLDLSQFLSNLNLLLRCGRTVSFMLDKTRKSPLFVRFIASTDSKSFVFIAENTHFVKYPLVKCINFNESDFKYLCIEHILELFSQSIAISFNSADLSLTFRCCERETEVRWVHQCLPIVWDCDNHELLCFIYLGLQAFKLPPYVLLEIFNWIPLAYLFPDQKKIGVILSMQKSIFAISKQSNLLEN